MFLKNFYKQKKTFICQETVTQRCIRFCLVGILLGLVFWGFWKNSEQRMVAMVEKSDFFIDQTRTLTTDHEKELNNYLKQFKKAYGVAFEVRVSKTPLPPSVPQNRQAVFLGICPSAQQVVLYVPPLVYTLLGNELLLRLQGPHFAPYFANNTWPQGLAEALNAITRQLDTAMQKRL